MTTIGSISIEARKGKQLSMGCWEGWLLFADGGEVSAGYGFASQQEALRTADTYRRRWMGESVETLFVNASDDKYPELRTGSAFVLDIEDEALTEPREW